MTFRRLHNTIITSVTICGVGSSVSIESQCVKIQTPLFVLYFYRQECFLIKQKDGVSLNVRSQGSNEDPLIYRRDIQVGTTFFQDQELLVQISRSVFKPRFNRRGLR